MHATKILSLLPLLVAAAMAAPTPAPAVPGRPCLREPANVDIEVDVERGGRYPPRPYPCSRPCPRPCNTCPERCPYPTCNTCNTCPSCPSCYYPYPNNVVDIEVEVEQPRRGCYYPRPRFHNTASAEDKKLAKRGDTIVIEERPVEICNSCLQGGKCCRDPKCCYYYDNCCYDERPCYNDRPCYGGYCCNDGYAKKQVGEVKNE
ncbi:hypothetical protein K440DRAFT_637835 [Wilcoxina mikolae CBS 423.85]|nr:hypothetical protein K440DRAFT_637835 [Wilcoxina mikolae CBS 423.85]